MTLLQCTPENHSTYRLIKYLNIPLEGKDVIFAGSHDLIEKESLQRLGVNKVYCLEANPFVFPDLQERIKDTNWSAHQACLWSKCGETKELFFYRNRKDGAGGLYQDARMNEYVDCKMTGETLTLKTITLDRFVKDNIIDTSNLGLFLLDLQGAELETMRGSLSILPKVDWVICEVSTFPVYEGGAKYNEITQFLSGFGFTHLGMQKDWGSEAKGEMHGDAIYRRIT